MKLEIHQGDCIEVLKAMDDNSIDAVVTDPPYGLKFMNKHWDYDVPSVEVWHEVLRVLKPGGHLLSFGGTRTYHRMVVAIEDAGFEIRDQIQWLYGSGFPKSHNISKGIDKKFGVEREKLGLSPNRRRSHELGGSWKQTSPNSMNYQITAPATDQAKQWDGFGTALKPANEPIVMARKPLSEKTIVDNVLKWGTGGINVDGCRVGSEQIEKGRTGRTGRTGFCTPNPTESKEFAQGRFPANLILDETAAESLGDPSRFFYVAKASKSERGEGNNHPTVKPIKLMSYLCRLITPPGGIVLDPFMGSGSSGLGALAENFGFVGIELNPEYVDIAKARLKYTAEKLGVKYGSD